LSYRDNIRAIALYPGLGVDELQNLLKSAFSIAGTAIGFLADVRGCHMFDDNSSPLLILCARRTFFCRMASLSRYPWRAETLTCALPLSASC
jgi:hypothetical protein